MKSRNASIGILFLVLAQIMVSLNIVTSKVLLESIPVLLLLEIRFILASLILLPLHWMSKARQESIRTHFNKLKLKDWYYILAQAICAGVLFNCLMLAGLNYTDANVAGIITSALPAMIAMMSWFVLGEKISLQKGLCVVFASIGLVVIAYDKLNGGLGEAHSFFGDSIVLLSLLPEATYYVLCKLYKNQLPLFLTSALLNGINAVLLMPTLFFIHFEQVHISGMTALILLLIGLTTGLFYVFWFIGSVRVDGIMASLSTAVMPVSTVILAWVILQENLSGLEFAGMSLVLFSIALYARR